jgi:hypothetical protein
MISSLQNHNAPKGWAELSTKGKLLHVLISGRKKLKYLVEAKDSRPLGKVRFLKHLYILLAQQIDDLQLFWQNAHIDIL